MIETARLRLRPFTAGDLDEYHVQIYSDPDVMRYMPGGKPRPKEGTKAVLDFSIRHGEQHGFTLWALVRQSDEQFLGHCGLIYLPNTPDVEVAYAIGKTFWGQGYTSEAARACLGYGFEIARLEQIVALAEPDNSASQGVMQKIGMFHQGTTSKYYNTELVLYQMARDDFQPDDLVYRLLDG